MSANTPPARTGACAVCGKRRKLTNDGKLPGHGYTIKVSRRAIHVVGGGSVTRPCPGAGHPPKSGTVQETGAKRE